MWESVYDAVSLTVEAVWGLKVKIQSHSARLGGDNCFSGEQWIALYHTSNINWWHRNAQALEEFIMCSGSSMAWANVTDNFKPSNWCAWKHPQHNFYRSQFAVREGHKWLRHLYKTFTRSIFHFTSFPTELDHGCTDESMQFASMHNRSQLTDDTSWHKACGEQAQLAKAMNILFDVMLKRLKRLFVAAIGPKYHPFLQNRQFL